MTNCRNGKSLIEMLAVMSVLSIIMAIAGMAFASMMRTDRAAREAVVSRANLSRLSIQFRNDIRASVAASLGAVDGQEARELRMELPDGTNADYRATDDGVERILLKGDETLGREEYRLHDSSQRFEIEGGDQDVVILVQTADSPAASVGDGASTASRVVRIEAVRGRRPHETAARED